jgi:glycerophosphoryl diester phosphodiesterase
MKINIFSQAIKIFSIIYILLMQNSNAQEIVQFGDVNIHINGINYISEKNDERLKYSHSDKLFYASMDMTDYDNLVIEIFGSEIDRNWSKTIIYCEVNQKRRILIAAHRGGYENDFKDNAPENSIANIQNAINHGFDIYESDIQRTSDGKFIIMHDPTIDRTTNGSGEVAKMSSEELKKYNLIYRNGKESTEKIPFLDEFISKGDGKIIFKIDYKPELKHLDDLLEQIKELGLQKRVILRFFYKKETVKYIAKYDPDDIPAILFRIKTLSQFNELKSLFNPKMISIFERRAFTQEQIQIIEQASKENIIVEAHTFFDGKKNREEYWEEEIIFPITIFHTKKPILFLEFLEEKKLR